MQEIKEPDLKERIEICRQLCHEVSKNAGITRAINEIIQETTTGEARFYLKSIFENQFKQLMINLNVLTLDRRSDFTIDALVKDFQKSYAGKNKKLGLNQDIENEIKYRVELKDTIKLWNGIRNKYAAHKDFNAIKEWEIKEDDISLFIISACNIVNTICRTIAVPQAFVDGDAMSTTYVVSSAINMEEEAYNAVRKNLIYK